MIEIRTKVRQYSSTRALEEKGGPTIDTDLAVIRLLEADDIFFDTARLDAIKACGDYFTVKIKIVEMKGMKGLVEHINKSLRIHGIDPNDPIFNSVMPDLNDILKKNP